MISIRNINLISGWFHGAVILTLILRFFQSQQFIKCSTVCKRPIRIIEYVNICEYLYMQVAHKCGGFAFAL